VAVVEVVVEAVVEVAEAVAEAVVGAVVETVVETVVEAGAEVVVEVVAEAVVEAVVEALIAAYSTNRYCKQIQQLASCLGCDNTYRIGASEGDCGRDYAVANYPIVGNTATPFAPLRRFPQRGIVRQWVGVARSAALKRFPNQGIIGFLTIIPFIHIGFLRLNFTMTSPALQGN
jgi:hypothetical protein